MIDRKKGHINKTILVPLIEAMEIIEPISYRYELYLSTMPTRLGAPKASSGAPQNTYKNIYTINRLHNIDSVLLIIFRFLASEKLHLFN